MPQAWSEKDEKQYQHIKKSERERGAGKDKAERIAASKVNKQRREEGRASNSTSQGKGNPNQNLEKRSKRELYNLAKERNVDGRSKMNKEQLIEALRSRQ
ncbi:Rho termination factor N-terminal domain-containing protein [Bowmanella dokdonensis]|uniref:Rho termination factor N-terminal domain-containing protein n=1 Tax=Bowmanella dokdonensis TaxID=751969 RepID=A0A939DKS1_9ALTE|nr:Rho termination factor N-terminal domain-containing protein [Bowmanella dokdonensis]MBN7824303.1 Rho termination factor N-terminal domain-containing protein [Bowmanella dokdonensis]